MATWEDLEDLLRRFPKEPAWGQAVFQGGGIVSTPASGEASREDGPPKDGPRLGARARKPNMRFAGPS
jgi:hypothetical protein